MENPVIDDEYTVTVNPKDLSIYAYALRRFALQERKQIQTIVQDLLSRGIIKESISPYCARIIPVRKKSGDMCLYVALHPLNVRVNKQKYPFSLIEDCFSCLNGKSVFSLLVMKDGFHQMKVHSDHTKYFSFATPDGQYEYVRLPFGYSEAPMEFQNRIVQILRPLISRDKILVYIDDILIPSSSVESTFETLQEVLPILKNYSFELNYKKCKFLRRSVEYLGYIISLNQITMSTRHTEAIQGFPVPKSVHQVQRFLGLANYFRKFIKDFARKAQPLYNPLKKSTDFHWGKDCSKSYDILKNRLTLRPVLKVYNSTAQTELHSDASIQGFGAIFLQKQSKNDWAPIAYFSQLINKAEANYHSFELEMLAIVRAVERFHIYLYDFSSLWLPIVMRWCT